MLDQPGILNCLDIDPVLDLVCLTYLWQSMAKIILKEVLKIVIVVVKSCCLIYVLALMVTVQLSFLVVTNAVVTINHC